MAEYEPVINRADFLKKWLEQGKPGTQFSVEHLYQLTLDIFATRCGPEWRNRWDPMHEEALTHPDGRIIHVTFNESARNPLSAHVTFFPGEGAAEDYNYDKGYEFRKTAEGMVVVEDDPKTETVQEVTLDSEASARLYREILRAHVNTPL